MQITKADIEDIFYKIVELNPGKASGPNKPLSCPEGVGPFNYSGD